MIKFYNYKRDQDHDHYSKSSFVKKYIQKLNIKSKFIIEKKTNKPQSFLNYVAEMLKTLTKYFNTFASTGFGCLKQSSALLTLVVAEQDKKGPQTGWLPAGRWV